MRAVGAVAAPVAGSLRVGTLSLSSPGQLLCRTNYPNASGCLATQASSLAGCSSSHRLVKVLDAGRLSNQRLHSGSFACRCAGGSEDSSNLPHERAGLRDGQSDGDDNAQDADALDGAGPSSVWDLPARHKRMQAAAAEVGDPLLDMVSSASKKLQHYLDNHKHVKPRTKADDEHVPEQEREWARWQQVFAEVEEQESLATVLKFQMEEAAGQENFVEAARLKGALDAMTATDTVAEIMTELKKALAEERYNDATLLRDKAGAGLVGWWGGLAEGGNDPYGRIINIDVAHGRLVAKGYSARQLATGAAGVPLFEIFVTKDGERDYQQQAVYLQRDSNAATESSPRSTKAIDLNVLDLENMARDQGTNETTRDSSRDTSEDGKGKTGDAALLDEGLSKIMSFLKSRIPDVKLKVFKVIAPEAAEADIPKIVEQLMSQEEVSSSKQEEVPEASSSNKTGEKKGLGSKFPLDGKIPVGSGGEEEAKETPIRLVVGGVVQNNIDFEAPRLPVRVPARLEHRGRNAFAFHIEDSDSAPIGGASPKEVAPSWKVANIATQASADLMPDDVAKVLWNVKKVPVKVSKEMGEIIRLAVSQAQRRRGLFKSTSFHRINVSESSTDPLSGLYIGAFGPYTSEVVQLQRKYGHWENEEVSSSGQNLEFFEYVEAVKLTGDLNVPAGQVTFRARTGRESRLSHRGAYPEELGVVTRYKGQGRLAEPGFRNPQWIDGELVLLDGKGGGHTNGAALGFVYSVPERHFLVLFKRLNLKE